MSRIWSSDIGSHVGERVRLAGWIHRLRRLGQVSFLVLRDAKGFAQIVVKDDAVAAELDDLHAESVVAVSGDVVAEPQAPGGVEVHNPVVDVIAPALVPPPFDMHRPQIKAQLPTILDAASVSLRHPRHRAAFLIASASMAGFRSTLEDIDFVEIQTPKIVAAATESGANVFAIDYFGRAAYLAQSPQLYKQILVGVFERVFEVGPVFRAEPHDTPRHLNEYVSLDVELGFIDDHSTVMSVLERVLRGMADAVRGRAAGALETLGVDVPEVPRPIPAIHFVEAQDVVFRETGVDERAEPDLSPAGERALGEWARREHESDFLFVTGFPMSKRPFYTHPDPVRPEYSRSFDLLFRGLELVTGGQRLHVYDDYVAALGSRGIDRAPLEGYLQAFRHGMPPHGGFAIGLERWTAQLAGAANVRETTLFPRDVNRLTP